MTQPKETIANNGSDDILQSPSQVFLPEYINIEHEIKDMKIPISLLPLVVKVPLILLFFWNFALAIIFPLTAFFPEFDIARTINLIVIPLAMSSVLIIATYKLNTLYYNWRYFYGIVSIIWILMSDIFSYEFSKLLISQKLVNLHLDYHFESVIKFILLAIELTVLFFIFIYEPLDTEFKTVHELKVATIDQIRHKTLPIDVIIPYKEEMNDLNSLILENPKIDRKAMKKWVQKTLIENYIQYSQTEVRSIQNPISLEKLELFTKLGVLYILGRSLFSIFYFCALTIFRVGYPNYILINLFDYRRSFFFLLFSVFHIIIFYGIYYLNDKIRWVVFVSYNIYFIITADVQSEIFGGLLSFLPYDFRQVTITILFILANLVYFYFLLVDRNIRNLFKSAKSQQLQQIQSNIDMIFS